MAYNCKVELNGVLGNDPKVVKKDGKTFVVLRMTTTDSYPVQDGDETIWKGKESLWHDVLVFRPAATITAKALKKKDIVKISGTLSYRPFKDENGYTQHTASIIATFIKKVELGKSKEPSDAEITEVTEEASQA